MSLERDLIDRLNQRANGDGVKEIPIEREVADEPPVTGQKGNHDCGDDGCRCRCCNEKEFDPTVPDTGVFEKLPPEEQEELTDLLVKSRELANTLTGRINEKVNALEKAGLTKKVNFLGKKVNNNGMDLDWNNWNGDNQLMDQELLSQWKAYKKRASDWIEKHKKFPSTIAKAMLLDEYDEDAQKMAELPWNERMFKEIVDKMFSTYQKKNSDYGASFDALFDEYGVVSAQLRIADKLNRFKTLTKPGAKQKVSDESVEDTLMDLANYAILTIIKLRSLKK